MPKHLQYLTKKDPCDDIKRLRPVVQPISEFGDELECDLLPLLENIQFEETYLTHYSMKNNRFLSCRWQKFKDTYYERMVAPFEFPSTRDYHFHNCVIKLLPRESTFRKTNVKYKMRSGPGVDNLGQIPIPCELVMNRGFKNERKMPKKYKDKENSKDSEAPRD